MDISIDPAVTHQVATACKPVIHTVTKLIPHVPFMAYVWATLASLGTMLAGFGLGWYWKGRGTKGVKQDISNAETTVKSVVSTI